MFENVADLRARLNDPVLDVVAADVLVLKNVEPVGDRIGRK